MRVSRGQLLAILILVIALLVVAVAAGSTSTHPFTSTATAAQDTRAPARLPSQPTVTVTPSAGPAAHAHQHGHGPNWLRLILLLGALAGIGVVAWRVANTEWAPWRGSRAPAHARSPITAEDDTPSELRDAIGAGLESLERGPAGDAIIACWVRVETAAAVVGVAVRPAETSTEFVDRVLAAYGARESALRRLSALYREARFSSHAMGEPDRHEARACLIEIQDDLARRHATT